MDEREKPLGSSLQRLADTLLNIIRNRIELLGIELEEEKNWFVATLCWVAMSLFFGFTAVLVITFTVVALAPEEARSSVMLAFSGAYLFAALTAVFMLRRKLKKRPPPFNDTAAELRKDIAYLRARQ